MTCSRSWSFTVFYLLITQLFQEVYIRAESEQDLEALIQTQRGLDVIPASRSSKYKRLQRQDLNNNAIRYVSPSAFNQTALRHIYLSFNDLQCVPDFTMVRDTIIQLNIGYNRLGECDNDKRYDVTLAAMRQIDFEHNGLRILPTVVRASVHLRGLYLLRNEFTQIPDWITRMIRMDYL